DGGIGRHVDGALQPDDAAYREHDKPARLAYRIAERARPTVVQVVYDIHLRAGMPTGTFRKTAETFCPRECGRLCGPAKRQSKDQHEPHGDDGAEGSIQ